MYNGIPREMTKNIYTKSKIKNTIDKGERKSYCLRGTEFLFEMMKKFSNG